MTGTDSKIIVIGHCQLILADCRTVIPNLGPLEVVATDPPYGMAYQSNYRQSRHREIAGDQGGAMLEFACRLKASHSSYVWMRWDNLAEVPKPRSLVTWVKNNWSMGDLDHEHARQTEVAAFYPGGAHFFPNGRPQDVINCPRSDNAYHPTQKPVALMEAVLRWTAGAVVDPFMGSGTTLVAAAKLGRKAIGIEMDPAYFDIACERVQQAYDQPDMFATQAADPDLKQADLLTHDQEAGAA